MSVDVSEIRKEGWVNKESAVIRTYRKRWMVLTPDRLYSFKGEMQYTDPTEEMDLRQCDTVKSADDLTNRPFSFTVQVPERNYFLAAMSDADRDEWVAAIGRTTEKPQAVETGTSPSEQPSSKPPWQLLKLATHTHRAGWGLAVCLLAAALTLSAVTQARRTVVAEGGRLLPCTWEKFTPARSNTAPSASTRLWPPPPDSCCQSSCRNCAWPSRRSKAAHSVACNSSR